jgi:hypothetical protein
MTKDNDERDLLAAHLGARLNTLFGEGTVFVLIVGAPDGEAFILPSAPLSDIEGIAIALTRFAAAGRGH